MHKHFYLMISFKRLTSKLVKMFILFMIDIPNVNESYSVNLFHYFYSYVQQQNRICNTKISTQCWMQNNEHNAILKKEGNKM